jgi:ABC-2 type transport system ATP-binding protein
VAEAVVRVENVGLTIGSSVILRDVDLALEGPALVAVLGPNGAGKTSLLDLLSGLRAPSRGRIFLFGRALDSGEYPRERVGVVLQREFAPEHMTVGEYAELFASIQRVPGGTEGILRAAELVERRAVPVGRVSGGEAQRLFIAAAAVHAPPLLLLDEPTAALDPESKRRIGRNLRERARSATVVLSTHDLAEAERLADTLVFVSEGQVKAAGPRVEVIGSATLEHAFFRLCGARILEGGERG